MQSIKVRYFLFLVPLLGLLTAATTTYTYAEEEPRASFSTAKLTDAETTLTKATTVYKNIINKNKVPSSVSKNAKCVAIFPSVVTAAIGVGGTAGDGVAFCRNAAGMDWGNPVFLDLAGGSFGLQAGVKSSDLVLYLTGDNARTSIQNGAFKLAGDLSAVAGTFDESYVAPPSGVVAYASTEGVFAGASVVGVDISHDKDSQRAFYGTYNSSAVFDGRPPAKGERSIAELGGMLPS